MPPAYLLKNPKTTRARTPLFRACDKIKSNIMANSVSTSKRTKFKRVHRSLRFRSGRDVMDVAPNDCPNITELLEKDAIQDRSVPALFNQIEGIADIGARVRDRFDILNYQNSVVRVRGARKDSVFCDDDK